MFCIVRRKKYNELKEKSEKAELDRKNFSEALRNSLIMDACKNEEIKEYAEKYEKEKNRRLELELLLRIALEKRVNIFDRLEFVERARQKGAQEVIERIEIYVRGGGGNNLGERLAFIAKLKDEYTEKAYE